MAVWTPRITGGLAATVTELARATLIAFAPELGNGMTGGLVYKLP